MNLISRQQKKRMSRRRRPQYPDLSQFAVGEVVLVERPECGVNIEHPAIAKLEKRRQRVIHGCFVFGRVPAAKPSRSKHQPHVGDKQIKRSVFPSS